MADYKEKAKEIVFEYYEVLTQSDMFKAGQVGIMQLSKKLAVVGVNKLIQENEIIEEMVGQGFYLDEWKQIKLEIELL